MENGKGKNLSIFGVWFFHSSFVHPLSIINLNMFLVLLEFTATSCSSMDSGEKGSNSYIPKYVWMNLWRAGYYFPEHSLSMDLNTNETNECTTSRFGSIQMLFSLVQMQFLIAPDLNFPNQTSNNGGGSDKSQYQIAAMNP